MIKVFLVEDEIIVREGIKNGVDWQGNGFEFVGEAGDGELAYPIIKAKQPDIVITDIKMPFMDGLDLTKLIKREMPSTKVVILSGYDEFDFAKKAITLGVTEYLLKPISSNQLIEALIIVRDIIIKERQQQEYANRYHEELKEYEELKKYKFFQRLVSSKQSYTNLIEKGKELGIDLTASVYSLILLKIFTDDKELDEYYIEKIQTEEKILKLSEKSNKVIFFNRITEGIAFFCMANDDLEMQGLINTYIDKIIKVIEEYKVFNYFIVVSNKEYRLRNVCKSFNLASKAFAYRYFSNKSQVIYSEKMKENDFLTQASLGLRDLDITKLKDKILESFLRNGTQEEINSFINEYFHSLGEESMESILFRQYIVVDFYLIIAIFIEQLGYSLSEVEDIIGTSNDIYSIATTLEQIKIYLQDLIYKALQ